MDYGDIKKQLIFLSNPSSLKKLFHAASNGIYFNSILQLFPLTNWNKKYNKITTKSQFHILLQLLQLLHFLLKKLNYMKQNNKIGIRTTCGATAIGK